jgi:hypothetical protein
MSNASETILAQYGWDALSGLETVQAVRLSKHGKAFEAKLCKSTHIADCFFVSYTTNSLYMYDFYNTAAEAEKAYKKEAKYVARMYAQY